MRFILQLWLQMLMPMFFGIGQGPSGEEKSQYGELSNIGNFGTSEGEADISQASDFWKSILSGDPNQLAKVLGPAYSNISKRGGQELKTLSEFSTRSGGTAAAGQQVGDEMRSEASSLEGNLIGGAASSLGSMGSGLLSTGLSAHEAAFDAAKTIQQQHAAKMNDIFKSIAEVATAVAGGIGGAPAAAAAYAGGAAQVAGSSGGTLAQPITDTYTGPEEIQ